MRKKIRGRKFSRNTNSRKALFRSLIRAAVLEGSITTTQAKAKSIQPEIDKLIKLVARDTIASRRAVKAKLGNDTEVYKELYSKYAEFAGKRPSGFTRMIALPPRRGDNAPMARIEWVDSIQEENENVPTKTKSSK